MKRKPDVWDAGGDIENEDRSENMEQRELEQLLQKVAQGSATVQEALLQIKKEPYEDLGFAKPDHHRSIRQGIAEVIYGEGKTPEQILAIAGSLQRHGQRTVLITRMAPEAAVLLERSAAEMFDGKFQYDPVSRIGLAGELPPPDTTGSIVIATGGTSDIPVAEEAAFTALAYGNKVTRLYDVGVSGLHRTLSHLDEIMNARVIIAVAGMEGALASVIGGLADCPVIAVPTSVGYGASFGGMAALLSMLNSCASGVSVVNIDNGFGAGYLASMINHM